MPADVEAEVLSNSHLSPDYNVVVLAAPEIARSAEPGQFVMLKARVGVDPLLRRPFSIFEVMRDSAGDSVGFSLLNKRVGAGTSLLYTVRPGERLPCLGPLGRPFTPVAPPARAWMVAGGVGLAPFATLAERLGAAGIEATLFYGARRSAELFHLDHFRQLGVEVRLATEDGSAGDRGRVTAPLERALERLPARAPLAIYACGPEPMLEAVARLAQRYDRPAQVSVERTMGCGLGGCYGCVVRVRLAGGGAHYVRSCLAGPVFSTDEIVWESRVR